jgi:hypothetical protein
MLSTTSPAFLQEPFIPTVLRDSILTLLGPKPSLATVTGARSKSVNDVLSQRLALIAYRAKIVAVMNILEVGVKTAENGPIMETAAGKMSAPRKPMLVARHAYRCYSVVADQRYRR